MVKMVEYGTAPWIPNELTWDAEMVGGGGGDCGNPVARVRI